MTDALVTVHREPSRTTVVLREPVMVFAVLLHLGFPIAALLGWVLDLAFVPAVVLTVALGMVGAFLTGRVVTIDERSVRVVWRCCGVPLGVTRIDHEPTVGFGDGGFDFDEVVVEGAVGRAIMQTRVDDAELLVEELRRALARHGWLEKPSAPYR